jgi:hypothetical protein
VRLLVLRATPATLVAVAGRPTLASACEIPKTLFPVSVITDGLASSMRPAPRKASATDVLRIARRLIIDIAFLLVSTMKTDNN